MRRIATPLFSSLAFALLCLARATAPPAHNLEIPVTVYHADPAHLWNRLYAALLVRQDQQGRAYGIDSLDPLLWSESTHLLEPESHAEAIRVLDEFIGHHGETLIRDPLKRALLARDLWAVFDWSVAREPFGSGGKQFLGEKQALQIRLAEVMRRLALTPKEIESLPDNYAQALASGAFPQQYDPAHSDRAFLPPDLFDPHGPWIFVESSEGPVAIQHLTSVSGRSRFLVFLRVAGGRKAGFDYIRTLWDFPHPWIVRGDAPNQADINPSLPSFPAGTEVALVRQMTTFDNLGNLTPAPIAESVQIRVYRTLEPEPSNPADEAARVAAGSGQSFFEIRLQRAELFAGKAGGLRAVEQNERDFLVFNAMPFDQVEDHDIVKNWNKSPTVLQRCGWCHRGSGIRSVNSRAALLKPNSLQQDPAYELPARWWENEGTTGWKQNRYDWGLLNGYWKASPSR